MFNIISTLKWGAILGIIIALGVGAHKIYEYHLDQIDEAVAEAKLELSVRENEKRIQIESQLREQSQKEKAAIEEQLKIERAKVSDLQRKLLVDHDLDRLLQAKPDMLIKRVNAGTDEYFKELEEATQ